MISSSNRFLSVFAACAIFISLPQSAWAQKESGFFDKQGIAYDKQYFQVAPTSGDLSIIRAKDGKEGDFLLYVTSKYGISGCVKYGKLAYETRFEETILAIKITKMIVDMRNLPNAPEYQCSGRSNYPGVAIPLNVKTLKDNNISQLTFESPGHFDYYNITMDDHSVLLTPGPQESPGSLHYNPMTIDNVINPLQLWLYPKNTVILRVAAGKNGYDVAASLDSLARSQGLVPMSEVIPDFKSPLEDPYSFYYVDKSKKSHLVKTPGIAEGIPFGEISLPATIYGATGDESVNVNLKVFAHTPGSYE